MPLFLIPLRRVSNWSILIDGNHPRRALISSCSVHQRPEGRKSQNTQRPRACGRPCPPPPPLASSVARLRHHAAERAVPRRGHRGPGRGPGLLEPRVAVPQPVPAQGVPDTDEDHAGSGCLSDGPGEPHPGRQLCGAGSHHLTQGPALVSLLGGFLREYQIHACSSRKKKAQLLLLAARIVVLSVLSVSGWKPASFSKVVRLQSSCRE